MYPALSSYLTRTTERRPRTAFRVPRPVDETTYTTAPPSASPTSARERKGRHRASAAARRPPRPATSRHGAPRTRWGIPPLSYGYASAALLTLTAALLAQTHGAAPVRPHAAPPAEQPETPRREPPPAPDKAPTTSNPPGKSAPHRSSPADTDAAPHHSRASAKNASSVLRVGNTGGSVRQLQEQLRQLRLYTGPVDGYYSHDVAAAVARMQQAQAIPEPLGVYGPGTRTAIRTAAM